jgi:hypothetical protein
MHFSPRFNNISIFRSTPSTIVSFHLVGGLGWQIPFRNPSRQFYRMLDGLNGRVFGHGVSRAFSSLPI